LLLPSLAHGLWSLPRVGQEVPPAVMGGGSQIMRMLIVTLSAALMLLSIVPQAGAAKSHLKCGGDNLQCGNLAKVCNPKNGKCCCLSYSHGTYH
jgi:hypothetical protein